MQSWSEQDEFVFVPDAVPEELLRGLVDEVQLLRSKGLVNRAWVPFYKRGGSVPFFTLREHAPRMVGLYRSEGMRELMSALVGRPMHLCPEDDPHSAALFLYDHKGDHVGYHHDSCHYQKGVVYTVLIGLVDRSTMRLRCRLGGKTRGETLDLRTPPGSMVIYNGCKVYHGTTPLRRGEDRVVLSLEYLTSPYMHPLRRLVANLDHAIRYFGRSGL